MTFEICNRNRYKLEKGLRTLKEKWSEQKAKQDKERDSDEDSDNSKTPVKYDIENGITEDDLARATVRLY